MEIDCHLIRQQRAALRQARAKARYLALESLIEGDFATFEGQLAAFRALVEREKRLDQATHGLGWLGRCERRHGFGVRELHTYAGLALLALAALFWHPAAGLALLGLGALALTRPRRPAPAPPIETPEPAAKPTRRPRRAR